MTRDPYPSPVQTKTQQERALHYLRTLAAAGFAATLATAPALAVDISGAGATFPYPI